MAMCAASKQVIGPDERHDPHCFPCVYYGKSTRTCDYILIEDHSRPCPAGAGCTARITKKEAKRRMTPKWDTTLGAKMHQDGCSDKEIAEHFGIAVSTVSYQRRNRWEKVLENSTPPEDNIAPVCAVEESVENLKEMASKPSAPVPVKQSLDIYELLEEATANMQGINAICTADAILQLWRWDSKEKLLKARKAIDYLLKKMEEIQ